MFPEKETRPGRFSFKRELQSERCTLHYGWNSGSHYASKVHSVPAKQVETDVGQRCVGLLRIKNTLVPTELVFIFSNIIVVVTHLDLCNCEKPHELLITVPGA